MPPESMPQLALAMRRLAGDLLDALDDGQRAAATGLFDVGEWHDWTYLPGSRPGLRMGELTAEQRERAFDLLHAAFSRRGVSDLLLVLRTEETPRELSSQARTAVPPLDPPYWLRILGEPSAEPWGWRISGHHLLAQATVVGEDVATAPQFFGAEPAEVGAGPHHGFQSLAREQDLARELVLVLED